MTQASPTSVAIAGGGLAGLASACALADSGLNVTVFERRPYLGGRASSYEHPGTGEVIDNCQHVLFRVCSNLIEFYQRIGVEDQIRWFDDMTFVEPGGRRTVMRASALPAPLHTGPSFLRFPFLSFKDKTAIARAIGNITLTPQKDTGRSFLDWCQAHGQTHHAIERFWKPILVSALSEDLDLISISSAAQVVRESMKSPAARHMGVPAMPLTDLYNRAGDYIRARGGKILFRNSLETFCPYATHVEIRTSTGNESFDSLILALPFNALASVLPTTPDSSPLREQLSHFESCPITGIHLWFDRQITDLPHAVLLDRTVQWMFHKSLLLNSLSARNTAQDNRFLTAPPARFGMTSVGEEQNRGPENPTPATDYIELVVSASKSLIDKSRSEIVAVALAEVREFFPAARAATLIKSAVIKEVHATYSPRPGLDAHRPHAVTGWPRVFLAGDWTATGWPATMEGAVRSGYLAAQALLDSAGISHPQFLVPDLPPSGLMRFFSRQRS